MAGNSDGSEVTVGIVGAGAMGRGIAQVSATGGMNALLYDAAPGAAAGAADFVNGMLDRAVEKGRLSADDAAAAKSRVTVVAALEALAPCDLVIEAVVEDLAVKRQVFASLEEIVAEEAIIASNTSSLRLAAIAADCRRRARIGGMHFFNPVPLMRLVEVIQAPETSPEVVARMVELGRRMGRVPVVVRDAPGFLVNLGGRAFVTEGLRIVSEGVATPAQVDAVMRQSCGYRMGPFELMDLTGIDVNFPVSRIVYDGYFQDRRLATSPLHESLYLSGRLGRKTGAGYYAYDGEGKQIAAGAEAAPAGEPVEAVFLIEPDEALVALCAASGARLLDKDDGESPLLAAPLGEDCATLAARLGLDHRRLVAVDTSADATRRLTVMTPPGGDPAILAGVAARLARSGAKITAIKDSPGFIAQRIRAMVANLGCEMAQIGLASPEDIDTAMTLGLNYPQGPLALADAMGPRNALSVLERLQAITGDDRYRPSLWLRRRALLGLAATTPE